MPEGRGAAEPGSAKAGAGFARALTIMLVGSVTPLGACADPMTGACGVGAAPAVMLEGACTDPTTGAGDAAAVMLGGACAEPAAGGGGDAPAVMSGGA